MEHTQKNLEQLQGEIDQLLHHDPKATGMLGVPEFGPTTVAVLRDRDLQPETFPTVTGLDATELSVAWAQDGRKLFAEGYRLGNFDRLARRWDEGGAGGFIDIAGARDTVMQFVPLRGERMLFADAVGFGLIDPTGMANRLQEKGSVDTRYATTSLRISADARTVQVTDRASNHCRRPGSASGSATPGGAGIVLQHSSLLAEIRHRRRVRRLPRTNHE